MGKYIHYYRNKNNFESDRLFNYVEPWTSFLSDETQEEVKFNKTEEEKERDLLYQTPLTFEITNGGTIYWKASNTAYTVTLEYKKNDGEWTEITSTTGISAPSIPVVSGDTVQFRGNKATMSYNYNYNHFSGTSCSFSLKGNIMSLINSTGFSELSTLTSAYTFYNLFKYCTGLTDASKLVLPATTLAEGCYNSMFWRCTSLTTAPALPATTLANYCYGDMFTNCWSLTTAPELPVTTLKNGCYSSMFTNCWSLTTAPELPATTLTQSCYNSMFDGCSGLTTAPELPATTLADYCYKNMFEGCTSLVQAPELPATTLAYYCYNNMFSGCTSLTQAPSILPATTLVGSCYDSMFEGCTSLATAPELPATTLAEFCYSNMFRGCTRLNYIKCLATTNVNTTNCNSWVTGVSSTGTFIKAPSMTGWTTGTSGIPTNWTVQDITS